MFIRELEKGECTECQRCTSAAWFECDNCHKEFVVHGVSLRARSSYCSKACCKLGSYQTIAAAVESRKRFLRTKYGRHITK